MNISTLTHINKALRECSLEGYVSIGFNPTKVLITGHSGAGKTTLADRLGKVSGVRVIHLDEWLKPIKKKYPQKEYEKLCVIEIERLLKKKESIILEGVQLFRVPRLSGHFTTILLSTPMTECAVRYAKSKTRRQRSKLHAFILAMYRNHIKWGKVSWDEIYLNMYD